MKRTLILLFLLAGMLWAQEYNLDELIQQGLKNSITIKTKAIQTDNAKSSLKSAYYDILPDASVSLSQSETKRQNDTKGITTKTGSLSVYKSLSLNEPTFFNLKQSIYDNKTSKISFEQAKKQFVYDTFAAYLDVLESAREVDIQQANVVLQERIFSDTRIQYQQGRKSAFDLNQADINRINSKINLQNAQNNLRNTRQNLFTELLLKDEGYTLAEPEMTLPAVDTLDTTAIEPLSKEINPLMIRMQEIQLKKDKLSLSQQKINFLPTITGSWSYTDQSVNNKPFNMQDYQDSYTISLTASYSLWNLFRHGEDYHRYRNSVKLSELELLNARVQLDADYEKIMRNLKYVSSSYHLQLRKKEQAAENLRIAEEKYRLGLISLLDLDQAQVNDLNAKLAANSDYYTLLKTKEQLNLLLSRQILGKW